MTTTTNDNFTAPCILSRHSIGGYIVTRFLGRFGFTEWFVNEDDGEGFADWDAPGYQGTRDGAVEWLRSNVAIA